MPLCAYRLPLGCHLAAELRRECLVLLQVPIESLDVAEPLQRVPLLASAGIVPLVDLLLHVLKRNLHPLLLFVHLSRLLNHLLLLLLEALLQDVVHTMLHLLQTSLQVDTSLGRHC